MTNEITKVTCRCGMTAKGFRGCRRIDDKIINYATCPRCGRDNILSEWTKPEKK